MKALLSFFTRPSGSRGFSATRPRARSYLLPLVGLVTGLPGAVLLLTAHFVPPGVAATLALGAVLLAAGLHHADGVLDVGDALMVRGLRSGAARCSRTPASASAGIGALFLVYAPTVAALVALCAASPGRAALALFAGEVSARSAMLLVLAFGKPAEAAPPPYPSCGRSPGRASTPAVAWRCWRRCHSSCR